MIDLYLQLLAVCFFGFAMAGYPCCCNPSSCSCCTATNMPSVVYVEFAGVANDGCSNCADWNGTVFELAVTDCAATLEDVPIDCTATSPAALLRVNITCQTSPAFDGQLQLLIYQASFPGSAIQVIKGPFDVTDCAASVVHTFTSGQIFNAGPANCDFAAASADITV